MSSTTHRLGLSLSGGGYRAAAFHLGTLRKLNDLGILLKVDVLSTISGGSITGACYCLTKKTFEFFEKDMVDLLTSKNVIKSVLLSFSFVKFLLFVAIFIGTAVYFLFTPYPWASFPVIALLFILLLRFQFAIFPVSREIEKAYNKFFYNKAILENLNDKPVLVLGSTNLQTGRPFTFSKDFMGDSTYTYRRPPVSFICSLYPVARAVTASSCVPFAFTPVAIKKEYFRNSQQFSLVRPCLVDGGVYDNQGIHKVVQEGTNACDVVIASDAGGKLAWKGLYNNTIKLVIRTVNVFMARIKSSQMVEDIYDNTSLTNKEIAYLSLGWDIDNCIPGFINNLTKKQVTKTVIEALQLKPEWVENPHLYETEITKYLEEKTGYTTIEKPTPDELRIARNVSTNLTPLSARQVECLMKQSAALTAIQVKLYCPTLLTM